MDESGKAITNTNPEPIIDWANNDTDDEVDTDTLGVSSAAINDTAAGPITHGSNNNIDNEINAGALGALGATIKDTDVEPIADGPIIIRIRKLIWVGLWARQSAK